MTPPRPKITHDEQLWLVWVRRFLRFWAGLTWFKSKWSIIATTLGALAFLVTGIDTMTGSHLRRKFNEPMHEQSDTTLARDLRDFRTEIRGDLSDIKSDVKEIRIDVKNTQGVVSRIPGVEAREDKYRHQQYQERRKLRELFGDSSGRGFIGARQGGQVGWAARAQ